MRSLLASAFAALALATAARADDTEAPVIKHTPVTSVTGDFVKVMARITDASKFFPQVFFRYESTGAYHRPIDMKPVKGEPGMYGANIPVKGNTVEYYIEAYDEFGNGPGRAGDPDKPIKVRVGEEPRASTTPPAATEPASPPPAATTPPPAKTADAWPPPSTGTTKKAPSAATSRSAQASAEPQRTWTWVVGGTGLGLLAGGLLAGLAAKSAGDAYNERLKDPQNNPVTLKSQYDAAQGMGSKATILTISGVVLLAGGAALYFLEPGWSGGSSGVSVAAAPVEGGGVVAVASRF